MYANNLITDLYQGPSSLCSAPSDCAQAGDFTVTLYPSGFSGACSIYESINLRIKRPIKSPGEVISLPNARVSLSINSVDATKTCSTWTGTVTWDSEVPSWGVTLNATCSETGKSGIKVVGTFGGDI